MFDYSFGVTVQIVSDYVMPSSRTADIIITSLFVSYMFVFLSKYFVYAYEFFTNESLIEGLNCSLIFYLSHIPLALATSYALSLDSASFNSANSTFKFIVFGTLGFDILIDLVEIAWRMYSDPYDSKSEFLFVICLTIVAKLCACGILFNIFWSYGVLLLVVLYCAYYAYCTTRNRVYLYPQEDSGWPTYNDQFI